MLFGTPQSNEKGKFIFEKFTFFSIHDLHCSSTALSSICPFAIPAIEINSTLLGIEMYLSRENNERTKRFFFHKLGTSMLSQFEKMTWTLIHHWLYRREAPCCRILLMTFFQKISTKVNKIWNELCAMFITLCWGAVSTPRILFKNLMLLVSWIHQSLLLQWLW